MNKSFTLLELLIVIAIIAVLSTVVIFALDPGEMMAKARDTKRLTDLAQLEKAIIVYLSEGNKNSSFNHYQFFIRKHQYQWYWLVTH